MLALAYWLLDWAFRTFHGRGGVVLVGLERGIRAGIAQLARASAFQAEGRGFESRFPLSYLTFISAHVAQ